jgi:hypothetical protein
MKIVSLCSVVNSISRQQIRNDNMLQIARFAYLPFEGLILKPAIHFANPFGWFGSIQLPNPLIPASRSRLATSNQSHLSTGEARLSVCCSSLHYRRTVLTVKVITSGA